MMPRLSTYLGHTDPKHTYWYLSAAPELMGLAGDRLDAYLRRTVTALAPTLQAFFTDRLVRQRQASGHTIAAYRDALKLLTVFAAQRTGKPPSRLDIADLDAPLVGAFLNHLETDRGNSVRTRNARLAAIHSLFRYAALRHPEHAADIATGPGDPTQTLRPDPDHLPHRGRDHGTAGRARPDTWTGRRDHALLMLACQTGLRATELTSLTIGDVHLGTGAHVSCLGKGQETADHPAHRRHRARSCAAWLAERGGLPTDPLFITRRGTPLSRDALQRRDRQYTAIAAQSCPTLREKKVSPHVLRHSAAMRLLSAGVDVSVIALWMGHENIATRRSTSTPTWRSRNGRWPAPRHRTPHPAATNRPTPSWPSSTDCDYAERSRPPARPAARLRRMVGITASPHKSRSCSVMAQRLQASKRAAVPAALLFAALEQGGGVMEGTIGISSSLVDFIQGLMIVLVLAATTLLYMARRRRRASRSTRPKAKAAAAPKLEPV